MPLIISDLSVGDLVRSDSPTGNHVIPATVQYVSPMLDGTSIIRNHCGRDVGVLNDDLERSFSKVKMRPLREDVYVRLWRHGYTGDVFATVVDAPPSRNNHSDLGIIRVEALTGDLSWAQGVLS